MISTNGAFPHYFEGLIGTASDYGQGSSDYNKFKDDYLLDYGGSAEDLTISSIFLADYSLRLYSAPELPRMVTRGLAPGEARLRWVLSGEAVVYALSTFPFFLDLLVDGRYSGVFDSGLNASWVSTSRWASQGDTG